MTCWMSSRTQLFYPQIFKLLKGNKTFEWDEKCKYAFQDLKKFLMTPLLLTKPINDEPLLLYLSVSNTAVRVALVREDGKTQ